MFAVLEKMCARMIFVLSYGRGLRGEWGERVHLWRVIAHGSESRLLDSSSARDFRVLGLDQSRLQKHLCSMSITDSVDFLGDVFGALESSGYHTCYLRPFKIGKATSECHFSRFGVIRVPISSLNRCNFGRDQ